MASDWGSSQFHFDGFEWHNDKAKENFLKHKIDFDDARFVFAGAFICRPDPHETEERWQAIGDVEGRILFVVFTERDGICRIISARRAEYKERKRYHALLYR